MPMQEGAYSTRALGTRPRVVALAALLPALFAVWLHAPVHDGGLLADELLLVGYVTEPGPDGLRPDWNRVAADFTGPWAFGNGTYYRPLVTLTLALDHWVSGDAGWMLHCTSIALFAICVFAVSRWFGELFGGAAAIVGGLLFAAHPAGHEPICWPCTRADFMVLAAAAGACITFVRYLRHGAPRSLLATAAFAAVALLCKETGLLLAAWLVLIDFGLRGAGSSLRARVTLHLWLLPLWLGYFVLRWWALGAAFPSSGAPPGADLPAPWTELQLSKLRAALAPSGDALPWRTPWTLGALLVLVATAAAVQRAHRRWLLAGVAWLVVAFVPVAWLAVSPNLSHGRIVLGGLVGVTLVVAAVLGRSITPRWLRGLGWLVAIAAVADLAAATRTIQTRYRAAWERMATLRQDFDVAGRGATVEAPLVLLAGVPADTEVPFLSPTMAFALTEPPLASRAHPFVSLALTHEPRGGHELLQGEAGQFRAMWEHGATLCYWSSEHTTDRLVTLRRRAHHATVELTRSRLGFEVVGAPASPFDIGGTAIHADEPFGSGTLACHGAHGPICQWPFAAARGAGRTWTSEVDLLEDRDFLVLGTLGGVRGFTVDPPLPGAELRVLPPPEPFTLRSPLRGARVRLADLAERLPLHSAPAGADATPLTAVLMHKAFAFRVTLTAGSPVAVPTAASSLLTEVGRFGGPDRIWYYLECRCDGRRQRSQIDWFERVVR